jgi:(p)ppGpp synthase/HD superfamily hydrolase
MPNRPLTRKEKKAWDFAKEAHISQVRKFINQPYFDAHVQKVNAIVKQYTRDSDILSASLLHDVIEDCFEDDEVGYEVIKSKFGKRIADLVLEVTSKGDEIDHDYDGSKTNYLIDKMIHMSDDALIIKLADRLQNISDAFTVSEKFRNKYFTETITIMDELEKNRSGFNRIHILLIQDIKAKLDNISSIFKIKRFKEI